MSEQRTMRCKKYHRALRADHPGFQRSVGDKKSRCPGWASDPRLQELLLAEAMVDPDGGEDVFGRPKRLWNAVAGMFFVAVSTYEQTPAYNCYPETPATGIIDELTLRAERSVEDVLQSHSTLASRSRDP